MLGPGLSATLDGESTTRCMKPSRPTIIHWDLCRNPVDLEQREGRIQRYGGLSIRRAIVREVAEDIQSERKAGESPWVAIQRLAEERLADESGLAPWWVYPGGGIRRYQPVAKVADSAWPRRGRTP